MKNKKELEKEIERLDGLLLGYNANMVDGAK